MMKYEEMEDITGLGLSRNAVAHLGGFGVLRQSVKLIGRSHPSLLWILFCLVLPFFLIVETLGHFWILKMIMPDQASYDTTTLIQAYMTNPEKARDMILWGLFTAIALFIYLVVLLFVNLCIIIAISYGVGSIYNGREATISDMVQAVSRLLWKLLATYMVWGLMVLVMLLVWSMVIDFAVTGSPPKSMPVQIFLIGSTTIILFVLWMIVSIITNVASPVTCFEEHYGFAAFKRGKQLLRNRWGSALLLLLLLVLLSYVFQYLRGSALEIAQKRQWAYPIVSLFFLLPLGYLKELIYISWALLYFSCVASSEQTGLPHQDISESKYQAITIDVEAV